MNNRQYILLDLREEYERLANALNKLVPNGRLAPIGDIWQASFDIEMMCRKTPTAHIETAVLYGRSLMRAAIKRHLEGMIVRGVSCHHHLLYLEITHDTKSA